LYWFGVKLHQNKDADFNISQWEAYQNNPVEISLKSSMNTVIEYMIAHNLTVLNGQTQLMINPVIS